MGGMHVIHPGRYKTQPKRRRWWPFVVALAIIVLAAGAVNYLRPLPEATATLHLALPSTTMPVLNWPSSGQAAVAANDYGILGTSGDQTPLATASIAKVITALCVLQKAPLALGQIGPSYTVDASDVATYQNYVAEDGSLIPVEQGEQITEYQALEALMIPSANNIADSLVHWVFGSQGAYAAYATIFLQQHGIDNTHIGSDASGFDPSTTSTASDLTQLGLIASQSPALMQIVGRGTATLPVIGTVSNYDTILGQSGINGIKTGNNETDTGAFLFSATKQVGGRSLQLTGTIMGAPNLNTALNESVQLATSLGQGFEQTNIVQAGQTLGSVQTAWGGSASIVATKNVELVRWKATPVTETHEINTKILGGTIGTLKAVAAHDNDSTALHLNHTISGPSFLWRLTRH
jgi:D-alanyl-D-alanine carboxypeptidase (penicillin-binding protein 5/6)